MDMYLSTQDTLSLQEMLDCDYKTDFDSMLAGSDLGLSLSGDLPPLELDDALGGSGDMTMWFSNGLNSANSNSSNSNFNLDFVGSDAGAVMVNPSSVMPVTLVTVPSTTSASAMLVAANLPVDDDAKVVTLSTSSSVTTAPSSSAGTTVSFVRTSAVTTPASPSAARQRPQATATTIRISAATSTSPVHVAAGSGLPSLLATSKTVPIITSSTKLSHQQAQQKTLTHIQVNSNQNHTRTLQIQQAHVKKHNLNNNNSKHFTDLDYDEKPYPKPAYSYSCLIAMALKNSKTGSLPVSEIYNFMCEHFPYFKTAPNGWKNSVRHNLSLNKCFEKIEKPTGNGSQQRKGCLWAMNPAKIAKMDEEVQKWSKKDPMAIKKAMVCPENLEMLERGEMKREFSSLSSISNGVSSSLSGGEDSDADDMIDVSDAVDTTGSAPCTPLSSQTVPEFIDINSVVLAGDSFDESSLTDFDIEVAEGIYEELEAEDDKLNLGITLTSTSEIVSSTTTSTTLPVVTSTTRVADYAPASKRSRLGSSTIQGNYVYKPMVAVSSPSSGSGSRRKAPLLLRASAGASSLIKLEDP